MASRANVSAMSVNFPPVSEPTTGPSKKSRKNPARRKAERAKSYLDQPSDTMAPPNNNPKGTPGKKAPRKLSAPPMFTAPKQAAAPKNAPATPPKTPDMSRTPPTMSVASSASRTPPSASKQKPVLPDLATAGPRKAATFNGSPTTPISPTSGKKKKPVLPALKRMPSDMDTISEGAAFSPTKKKPILPSPLPSRTGSVTVSTASSSRRGSLAMTAPALITGGIIGCAAGAAILTAVSFWYDFAGVKAAITTAQTAKLCVDNLSEEIVTSLSAGTYNLDEALDMLRRTTLAYGTSIPEGALLIERVFREINTVRQTRGSEVEALMQAAYADLRSAGNKRVQVEEMRNILFRHLGQFSLLGGKALQEVITRNPRLKPYRDTAIKAVQGHAQAQLQSQVPTMINNLAMRYMQSAPAPAVAA